MLFCNVANAQIIRAEELEAYACEKYGVGKKGKWEDKAKALIESGEVALNKNNSLEWTEVIDCGNATKQQLYVALNYWFTATFNDANSVIKLNDKDAGVIIGQGYMEGVAVHTGGSNKYIISIKPMIKVDIKDKKIRVTYTIQAYDVTVARGAGGFMQAMGAMSGTGTKVTVANETWLIDKSYPFLEKDQYKAHKSTSKGLIMACAYSQVVMDKIKAAVQEGISGNENDNW